MLCVSLHRKMILLVAGGLLSNVLKQAYVRVIVARSMSEAGQIFALLDKLEQAIRGSAAMKKLFEVRISTRSVHKPDVNPGQGLEIEAYQPGLRVITHLCSWYVRGQRQMRREALDDGLQTADWALFARRRLSRAGASARPQKAPAITRVRGDLCWLL